MLEDNFNSVDGPLDRIEPLLRLTAEVVPAKLAGSLELLSYGPVRGHVPRRGAARIAGDLGPSGNVLKLFRDLGKRHPRGDAAEKVDTDDDRVLAMAAVAISPPQAAYAKRLADACRTGQP